MLINTMWLTIFAVEDIAKIVIRIINETKKEDLWELLF